MIEFLSKFKFRFCRAKNSSLGLSFISFSSMRCDVLQAITKREKQQRRPAVLCVCVRVCATKKYKS